jgi:hypothetical protein
MEWLQQNANSTQVDLLLAGAMDDVGLVGAHLRSNLSRDLKSKLLLRRGADAIEVVGAPGSGRHTVIDAAHRAAVRALGRSDRVVRFRPVPNDTNLVNHLNAARHEASGATLVIEDFGALPEAQQITVSRVLRQPGPDALTFAVSERLAPNPEAHPATCIQIRPLHEREEDIWELVDHFFDALRGEMDLGDCVGFSRQARTDLAEVIRETSLESVRRVRDVVRDIVFEAMAVGALPLKLTSEHVRPHLERAFGQTEASRRDHQLALVESQFADNELTRDYPMLEQLAELHGIPVEVLRAEVDVLARVVASIDGLPRSYRNIMAKAEDVQRAALWILTGATTQADFRRYFGDEGFMRPTKSVAWAFYNRVFQRDS